MTQIVRVDIFFDDTPFATAGEARLDVVADSFIRRITFADISFSPGSGAHPLYMSEVGVTVNVRRRDGRWGEDCRFALRLTDWTDFPAGTWSAEGIVTTDYMATRGYFWQPLYDILYRWQAGADLANPVFNPASTEADKRAYIAACFVYSGIAFDFKARYPGVLDWDLVRGERDICLLMSELLYDDRGYLGGDMRTFRDCFDTFREAGISFADHDLVIVGARPADALFEETRSTLAAAGFNLTQL